MIRRVASDEDRARVVELLRTERLVIADLPPKLDLFWLAEVNAGLVGCVGLEPLADGVALLRSLVVTSEQRGLGLGRRLLDVALAHARHVGNSWVYLLTTSAGPFFARAGFERVGREVAGPVLSGSRQWEGLCPSSAECYRRALGSSGHPRL